MKYAKYLLVLSVIGSLFIMGCPEGGDGRVTVDDPFIGGDRGLLVDFITDSPPDQVFDENDPFTVGFKIENVGEYDVIPENYDNPPSVEIKFIDPADFGASYATMSTQITEDLEGGELDPTGNIIQGTITDVEFPTDGNPLQYQSEVAGAISFTFRGEVCYEYGTTAISKLCVKEKLRESTTSDGICEVSGELPVANSGAPVHIARVDESAMGANKIRFAFVIRHVGPGDVFRRGTATPCDATFENENKVWVEVNNFNLGTLSCNGLADGTPSATGTTPVTGYTTLFNGERTVRCTLEVPEPRDLEKPLEIKLKYAYEEHADKEITVKHSG